MDTLEFFKAILPDEGWKVLAEFRPDQRWPVHTFYKTHEEAAEAALKLDAAGRTVYHACATYLTDNNRKQENAGWMKAFWIDADVETGNPEKYNTQADAIRDIARAAKALGLPLPLIVSSGGGIHGYWTLTERIGAAAWQHTSSAFKSALSAIKFRQDKSRTADAASVLRPVGTHWRKNGSVEVRSLSAGRPISHAEFSGAVGAYLQSNGVLLSRRRDLTAFAGVDGDDLGSGAKSYAPSSAEQIIRFCPTLAHVAGKRGAVEEPLWRAMLGLVKFTTEGAQRCHEWSAGHPEYDEVETQTKIDRWTAGPTTCDFFRGTNGNKCDGCQQTVSSPIHLGYTEEAGPPDVFDASGPGGDDQPLAQASAEQAPAYWPKKAFMWSGSSMCHAVKDEQDMVKWVPFCETLFYPTKRIRDIDGQWLTRIRHKAKDSRWHEFDLPSELIGAQHGLTGFLAGQEVFIYGKNGVNHVKDYLREYTLTLQQHGVEQLTHDEMGWVDNAKAFVVGNVRITPSNETVVLSGERIKSAGWDKDFGTKGTQEDWVRLVDHVYNRDRAEPYQFAIGAAFAAPLVEITAAGNWHGIPVALSGPSGLGKTTICKVAASIYGRPETLLVNAGKSGSTMNGMLSRIGAARNLPVIYDELTEREPEEVSDFLYALSTGRPKDRNRSDGTLINQGLSWNTISFFSSNKSITGLLFQLDEKNVTEATQIRVFEIMLDRHVNNAVWGDMNAVDIIEHQLLENYGHVGRTWLKYVIDNKEKLVSEIRSARAKYNTNSHDETRERYYRDLIATVVVAVKHARKIGLLNFDVVRIAKWAKENTFTLRARRADRIVSAEEYINQFLASLHGRLLVTNHFRDGRGGSEALLEPLRAPMAGRLAIQDRVLLVSKQAIVDWCTEARIDYTWFIAEMDKHRIIKHCLSPEGKEVIVRRERLGRGTNAPSSPTLVHELEFDEVIETVAPGRV